MRNISEQERIELRLSIPEKLRFPKDATFVTISRIAKKWGVSRNQAITLVLSRYGMDRINVSRSLARRTFRIDVDDYYRATAERLESGILTNPSKPEPGLFGDCRQFDAN